MSSLVSQAQAAELLANANKILLLTHENPDGDAIGSCVGLSCYLKNIGKQIDWFTPAMPEIYRPFAVIEPVSDPVVTQYDLIVQLDTATSKRIAAPQGVVIDDSLPLLVIDHHKDNQLYGRWNFVESAPATTSLVFQLISQEALKIAGGVTQEVATALLLGLITDTGCYRFSNATPEALELGGKLMRLGGDNQLIINTVFFSKPLARQQFEAELVNSCLELFFDNRLAVVKIPTALIEKYQIVMSETEGLVDVFRGLAGVDTAVLLYYRGANELKISGRANNPKFPIGPAMRQLGGGGHDMAAGCLMVNACIDQIAQKIVNLIGKEYKNEI